MPYRKSKYITEAIQGMGDGEVGWWWIWHQNTHTKSTHVYTGNSVSWQIISVLSQEYQLMFAL